MAEAVERTDELVREYLLFRGFTHTLRQLDAEIKADKEKGFRVREDPAGAGPGVLGGKPGAVWSRRAALSPHPGARGKGHGERGVGGTIGLDRWGTPAPKELNASLKWPGEAGVSPGLQTKVPPSLAPSCTLVHPTSLRAGCWGPVKMSRCRSSGVLED